MAPGVRTTYTFEFVGKPHTEGPGGAWTFLKLPKAATSFFGTRGIAKIVVTMKAYSFRTTAFADGSGGHSIYWNKTTQRRTGVRPGDSVHVTIALDRKPRRLAVPKELRDALAKAPKAKTTFAKLPPSHKKAYVEWIMEARRSATRARRVKETVARLRKGRKFGG